MSIRLPQRINEAPVGPDPSSLDGSTLRPLEGPAAAEYINPAASSRVTAATANPIAARLEMGLFPGATVNRPIPLVAAAGWRRRRGAVQARRAAPVGARRGWQNPGGRG